MVTYECISARRDSRSGRLHACEERVGEREDRLGSHCHFSLFFSFSLSRWGYNMRQALVSMREGLMWRRRKENRLADHFL